MVGQKITVHYQPYALDRLFLKEDDQYLSLRLSGPLKKTRHPGLKKPPEERLDETVYRFVLEEALGRSLQPEELTLFRTELARPDLAEPGEISRRLTRFVARSGRELHLQAYLHFFRRR